MDSTSGIAAVGNNTSIIFGEATEIAKYCKTMPIFGGILYLSRLPAFTYMHFLEGRSQYQEEFPILGRQ